MEDVKELANLLRRRNEIELAISRLINRPAEQGHIGEYIASQVFGISLNESATHPGHDGYFMKTFPLEGKSVNVKFYGKQEGILDIAVGPQRDYYLVLTGPTAPAKSSRNDTRPKVIEHVYLFDAAELVGTLTLKGNKIGIASSVSKDLWESAEVYPSQTNTALPVLKWQRDLLDGFSANPTLPTPPSTRPIESIDPAKETPQVVLEVGVEGGSASILRFRCPTGAWQYAVDTNEALLADFLTEEDRKDMKFESHLGTYSAFGRALRALDRWPWVTYEPVRLHLQYEGYVLQEVERRGGQEQVQRWRESLRTNRELGW